MRLIDRMTVIRPAEEEWPPEFPTRHPPTWSAPHPGVVYACRKRLTLEPQHL